VTLAASTATAEEKVNFEKEILPILDGACSRHSARAKKPKGDSASTTRRRSARKSRSDNLIFPRKPEKSLLLK
jgi:hypothetical protein